MILPRPTVLGVLLYFCQHEKGAEELAENEVSLRAVIKILEGETSTYCIHYVHALCDVIACQRNVALCHHSV